MYAPKHPWLATIFIIDYLVWLLVATLGISQLGHLRSVLPGIVVGLIFLMGAMTNASMRWEKSAKLGHHDYPNGPLWLMFGVVPAVASFLFWAGLALSTVGAPASPTAATSVLYPLGLVIAGCGVVLSIGLAASPRKRVPTQCDYRS